MSVAGYVASETAAQAARDCAAALENVTQRVIKLRKAANEARDLIKRYRDEIIESECLFGPDGQPLLETMGDDVREEVAELDDLIERLS